MSEFIQVLNTAAEYGPATAAVVASSMGLRRVVGPSLDAVGEALGKFSKYRAENLLKIGEKAQRRLGTEGEESTSEDEQQGVHPRVAREVLDAGSWINNDLHQEYLAALLVKARTADKDSDSDAYLARVVTGLTAEQVHLHYAMMAAYENYWRPGNEVTFPFPQQPMYRRHGVLVERSEMMDIFPGFESAALGLTREGIVQTHGTLPESDPYSETHVAIVPSRLAFDMYMVAIGARILSPTGALMSRAALALAMGSLEPPSLPAFPEPEPRRFVTSRIYDLGL